MINNRNQSQPFIKTNNMDKKLTLKDEDLKQIRIDSVKSLFNVSPLHAVECLRTADEIIESLDEII